MSAARTCGTCGRALDPSASVCATCGSPTWASTAAAPRGPQPDATDLAAVAGLRAASQMAGRASMGCWAFRRWAKGCLAGVVLTLLIGAGVVYYLIHSGVIRWG